MTKLFGTILLVLGLVTLAGTVAAEAVMLALHINNVSPMWFIVPVGAVVVTFAGLILIMFSAASEKMAV